MTTHEPTAFPIDLGRRPRRRSRTALLALGGAGLTAVGLAAGLMLRPAPETPVSVAAGSQTVAKAAPDAPYSVQPLQGAFAPAPTVAAAPPTGFTPPTPRPAATDGAPHPVTQPAPARRVTPAPTSAPRQMAGSTGESPAWREPTRPVAVCSQCGVVEGVRAVQVRGEASGLGAVAGGVLGGVLGNQVGKGNGRAIATVLGAVGGGVAGNEVEKRTRSETVYDVRVRMDDGSVRTLQQRDPPAPGSSVRVEGNRLVATPSRAPAADEPRYVRAGQRS